MKSPFIILLPMLSMLSTVAAHGYIRNIVIDGNRMSGPLPNGPPIASAVRQINDASPVKGANNRAMNCGPNAKISAVTADARPGSRVTFDWAGGDNGNWPHDTGPMLTYMAKCDGPCDRFDAINAQFFKIDEVGRKGDGTWVQKELMSGGTYTVTLPTSLPAGEYLIRHEIIGLHLAQSQGGAEFYPSCIQVRMSAPSSPPALPARTMQFPGAYSDTDPGILVPEVFNPRAEYNFPGGPVAFNAQGTPVNVAPADEPSRGSPTENASATPTPTRRGQNGPPLIVPTLITVPASGTATSRAAPTATRQPACLAKRDRPYRRSRFFRHV